MSGFIVGTTTAGVTVIGSVAASVAKLKVLKFILNAGLLIEAKKLFVNEDFSLLFKSLSSMSISSTLTPHLMLLGASSF